MRLPPNDPAEMLLLLFMAWDILGCDCESGCEDENNDPVEEAGGFRDCCWCCCWVVEGPAEAGRADEVVEAEEALVDFLAFSLANISL